MVPFLCHICAVSSVVRLSKGMRKRQQPKEMCVFMMIWFKTAVKMKIVGFETCHVGLKNQRVHVR